MRSISNYLKKFEVALPVGDKKKKIISSVLSDFSIFVSKENISIRGGVAYIKTSPSARQKIFLSKEEILFEIQKKAGDSLRDVR